MPSKNRRISESLSVAITAAVAIACSGQPAFADYDRDQTTLADDTLLLMLAPHTDIQKVKSDLFNEAGVTTIADMHVNVDDYSILQLKPATGAREVSFAKILSMQNTHKEYQWLQRNHYHQTAKDTTEGPNDPDFTQQWNLSNMNWTAARAHYMSKQHHYATVTVISSGVCPYNNDPTSKELGAYITQWDATNPPGAVQEPLAGYHNEGNLDASLVGALTNNDTAIAGAASFQPSLPCKVTMIRMTDLATGKIVSDAVVDNAITWAINNQKIRGGPGPINYSYGIKGKAVWNHPTFKAFANSMVKQNDIFVIAAGDVHGLVLPASDAPQSNMAVVQATGKKNEFYYTEVTNDKCAAPGTNQPCILNGKVSADGGSSASAPLWSATIAMLRAMNPSLSSLQAHQIILQTGTKVSGAQWKAVIPNWDEAIEAALRTAPK